MQGIRPFAGVRSAIRASPVASSSRIRLPPVRPLSSSNDRYIVIRDFFTRQSALAKPSSPRRAAGLLGRSRSRLGLRFNSTSSPSRSNDHNHNSSAASKAGKGSNSDNGECPHCNAPPSHRRDHAQNYTPFIRRLIQQSALPIKANYRPSKEELLAAASSWWERLRIRIKWFTIRGWRRFNTDDLSAFASWFVLGNSEYSMRGILVGLVRGLRVLTSSNMDPDWNVSRDLS